jgi:FkbH-like protein
MKDFGDAENQSYSNSFILLIMYQLNWAQRNKWNRSTGLVPKTSALKSSDVEFTMKMTWEEHCVECAVPECHKTCSLYERRRDGACARFVYGIVPNEDFKGRYAFGADIKFKKWAKLEADLNVAFPATPISHSLLKLMSALPTRLQKLFKYDRKEQNGTPYFDSFVIECYSPEEEPFTLMLEYFVEKARFRTTRYRQSFTVNPGHNFFSTPFDKFGMQWIEGYLYLYPEKGDVNRRLIFTWADFVKYKRSPVPGFAPADKVKCVAWDLDNTIWRGILSEQAFIEPNLEALEMVKKLDERGILQTVVSKNDFEPAWQKLEELGVSEYFLFPEINWNRKSSNLKAIAERLNIDLNSFAVIDDSPFERAEIKESLPQVRVYPETRINEIIRLDEFDVPITDMSRSRRLSYATENIRSQARREFNGAYDDFLRSCRMELNAFVPESREDVIRCWELIHRSNQLNLSGRRHSLDEFRKLVVQSNILPIALNCRDRFGDYGTIGYITIDMSFNEARIDDFVLSCRVAQKKVEHAFLLNFVALLSRQRCEKLLVKLVRSAKNKPLQKVLSDLPFKTLSDDGTIALLEYSGSAGQVDIIDLSFDSSVFTRYMSAIASEPV